MSNLRKKYITDELTGVTAKVNSDGQLHVVLDGPVIDNNSSATPLGIAGVFTGTAFRTTEFAMIIVNVYSDVASATDGLQIEFSSDGTNWDHTDNFTIAAATGKVFSFQTVAEYCRVVYTNGAVAQTEFRLQTLGKNAYSKPSSHRIADSVSDQDDAELMKSVITGEDAVANIFRNINAQELDDSSQNIDGSFALIVAAQLMGRISDTLVAPVYTDPATQVLVQIEHEHHEIHDGDHYLYEDVVDLALNNVRDLRITTPNTTKWPHAVLKISCESETDFHIYEGVTIVTAGTSITPLNNNRNSSNTSGLTMDYIDNTSVANADADTTVAGATQISHQIIGGGKDGGISEREKEIILKQNTVYSIRVVANTAGYVNFSLNWYELTNKN